MSDERDVRPSAADCDAFLAICKILAPLSKPMQGRILTATAILLAIPVQHTPHASARGAHDDCG